MEVHTTFALVWRREEDRKGLPWNGAFLSSKLQEHDCCCLCDDDGLFLAEHTETSTEEEDEGEGIRREGDEEGDTQEVIAKTLPSFPWEDGDE